MYSSTSATKNNLYLLLIRVETCSLGLHEKLSLLGNGLRGSGRGLHGCGRGLLWRLLWLRGNVHTCKAINTFLKEKYKNVTKNRTRREASVHSRHTV